jgi:hypothetical protein
MISRESREDIVVQIDIGTFCQRFGARVVSTRSGGMAKDGWMILMPVGLATRCGLGQSALRRGILF